MYLENKYSRWYSNIIERARTRSLPNNLYTETHHIIPESFYINRTRKGPLGWIDGDPEATDNKVDLTAREHFLCHVLLTKMLTGTAKAKMINALWAMTKLKTIDQKRYKITGRTYQTIKTIWSTREISEETRQKISEGNKGKKMPDDFKQKLDKYWTNENRKIHAEKIRKVTKGKKLSEETKEKLRNKTWTDKALQSRQDNCLKNAAARKDKPWSDTMRTSREDTYYNKNKDLANSVFEIMKTELSINAIAKTLTVDWKTVKNIIDRQEGFNKRFGLPK